MAELTRRLQLLLEPEQMEYLQAIARQRNKSVAELIREAVEKEYSPRSNLRAMRALEGLKRNSWLAAEEIDDSGRL